MTIQKLTLTTATLLATAILFASGCSKTSPAPQAQSDKPDKQIAAKDDQSKGHDHSGWWCDEHGVPEGECGLCNAKLAAEFQKKGDWCEKHDRPDSQCFICHPELKEKFAAQYRAKYGKEPPALEEEAKEETKKDGSE